MGKIKSIKTHPVVAPLQRKQKTAYEAREDVSIIIVELQTDDGIVGYGKINNTPLKDIVGWVEKLSEIVIGMDASPVAVWEKMFSHTAPAPDRGAFPRSSRALVTAAMAGIDFALWDALGKRANLPVFRLLGGENRPVMAYSTGGYYVEGGTPESAAAEIAKFVEDGYKAVKLKGGGSPLQNEIARVRATREAIGPDVKLMVDVSGAYDLEDAIEYARAIAPYDITWLEEPMHWYLQPADYVRLAQASPVPIAHGEREWHRFTTRDFISSGAIKYVQFDASRHAGFTEGLRIAHFADQCGVLIAPHHAPELQCHLIAAFPRCGFVVEAHGLPQRDPIWHNVFTDRAQLKDGYFHLSEKPGFGVEFDWDFIEKHRA
ncbi:mandelate racemase/muconate lactonizing enzyme family protein [Ensifer adhaerens]|uniref:Mandelate racemase/muconate lactonizing enzyme family protein n=1 Tax=Ensifer adhaerens TaxID=106592 RepID=A0A9Q9DE61_ENSAD|nr:mandelate racemase/muconate lactonizing enzyme family protein [Ensifer adhaerens]USJ28403.1 mandelate racemase/muconate lactonizing enzyme family protein [Ensifer adhaerens]